MTTLIFNLKTTVQEHWRAFDSAWFARHQRALLWLLAAPVIGRWFRWVLCIRSCDIGYDHPIVQLLPHAYVVRTGTTASKHRAFRRGFRPTLHQAQTPIYTMDARTHPKFAKRLYYAFAPLWWALHAWDWAVADRWIPELSFGFSTLTAYPDADPETSTVDGYVRNADPGGAGTTWSSARNDTTGGAASAADATAYAVRFDSGNTTNQWRYLIRSILLFDTSTITSSAVISSAALSVYCSDKIDQNSTTPDWDVITSTPASNTGLVNGDFAQVGSTSQTGAAKTYAGTTTGDYNTFTFNSTGRGNVSKTGISKFGLRNSNYDIANVAPNYGGTEFFSGFQIRWADYAGTTSDPKLEVTYTTPQIVAATNDTITSSAPTAAIDAAGTDRSSGTNVATSSAPTASIEAAGTDRSSGTNVATSSAPTAKIGVDISIGTNTLTSGVGGASVAVSSADRSTETNTLISLAPTVFINKHLLSGNNTLTSSAPDILISNYLSNLPNYLSSANTFNEWIRTTNNLISYIDNTDTFILVAQNATPRVTTGNISINGVATIGELHVTGAISKGSGSFRIDHPLPSRTNSHYLVHSFVESPQADLMYRGTVNLENGCVTVNIDTAAGMTQGTFVVLCRNIQCFTTNESDWSPVRGYVEGNILTIESQNTTSDARISWMVVAERQDPHIMSTNWTDMNGKVIVEPRK